MLNSPLFSWIFADSLVPGMRVRDIFGGSDIAGRRDEP
jgi:hypothetical protein